MFFDWLVFLRPNALCFLGSPPPSVKASSELAQAPTNSMPAVPQLPSSDAFAAVAQLFQTTQGQQVSCLMLRWLAELGSVGAVSPLLLHMLLDGRVSFSRELM